MGLSLPKRVTHRLLQWRQHYELDFSGYSPVNKREKLVTVFLRCCVACVDYSTRAATALDVSIQSCCHGNLLIRMPIALKSASQQLPTYNKVSLKQHTKWKSGQSTLLAKWVKQKEEKERNTNCKKNVFPCTQSLIAFFSKLHLTVLLYTVLNLTDWSRWSLQRTFPRGTLLLIDSPTPDMLQRLYACHPRVW